MHTNVQRIAFAATLIGIVATVVIVGRRRSDDRSRDLSGTTHQRIDDKKGVGLTRGKSTHGFGKGSSNVPSLVTANGPLVPETDSTKEGYEFEKMYALLDGNMRQIFEHETRDPVWAPEIEGRIRSDLQRDFKAIGADAAVNALECRATTCRLVIRAKDRASLDRADDFAQNFARGDYIAHDDPDGNHQFEGVLLYGFSKERRSLEMHEKEYQAMRKWRLMRWREAKTNGQKLDYELPAE